MINFHPLFHGISRMINPQSLSYIVKTTMAVASRVYLFFTAATLVKCSCEKKFVITISSVMAVIFALYIMLS